MILFLLENGYSTFWYVCTPVYTREKRVRTLIKTLIKIVFYFTEISFLLLFSCNSCCSTYFYLFSFNILHLTTNITRWPIYTVFVLRIILHEKYPIPYNTWCVTVENNRRKTTETRSCRKKRTNGKSICIM